MNCCCFTVHIERGLRSGKIARGQTVWEHIPDKTEVVRNEGTKMWWIVPNKNKMNEHLETVTRIGCDDDRREMWWLEDNTQIRGHSLLWLRVNSSPRCWSSAMASSCEIRKTSREAGALLFKKHMVAIDRYSYPCWNCVLLTIFVLLWAFFSVLQIS